MKILQPPLEISDNKKNLKEKIKIIHIASISVHMMTFWCGVLS